MNNTSRWILSLCLLAAYALPVRAEPSDAFEFFQEEAKVITASRREQSVQDLPVAVEVITAEDIKASGAINLWDLLRYRAGMNVTEGRSAEGNRAVVSMRGFGNEFVRSLQVLVDGRSVYQSFNGGVYWEQLPVQIQDIERIEIVKGPNAALYGSNAGLGVINIITKKPKEKAAVSVTGTGGNLDTHMAAESAEATTGNIGYRLSHTYRENMGYPLAATGDTGTDFLHENKINFRGSWTPQDKANVEVFTGGSWLTSGLQRAVVRHDDFDQDFQMVKFSQGLREDDAFEATASRNNYVNENGPAFSGTDQVRYLQYDAEALYRLNWWDQRFYTTSGISYSRATAESQQIFPAQGILINDVIRGFINQNVKLTDRLSLVGAASMENSATGGNQPAYQAAALYHVTAEQGLRASYSVAPTLPSFFSQDASYRVSAIQQVQGDTNFVPEKLTSYEVGYRGQFHHLIPDVSLFYMTIKNLESVTVAPSPFPVTILLGNGDSAIARGAEASLTYRFRPGQSVYANYTYEHITDALDIVTTNAGTPSHMFNLGGMTPLVGGFSFSANIGYKDNYFSHSDSRGTTVAVASHARVDTRLGYLWPSYPNLEVFLACQNMTQSDHVEFADGLTVPRTYQGGLTLKFGSRS